MNESNINKSLNNITKMTLGYNDIDGESYHEDREYISSSGLKLLLSDPRTFYKKYVKGQEDEGPRADHFNFGSYVHTLILEPELTDAEYGYYEGIKRGKNWEEWQDQNPGKTPISPSQKQQAFYMVEEFNKNVYAKELISNGDAEKTLCIEMGGVKIKVRADYLQGTNIVDLKTTGFGTSLEEVQAATMKWSYDLSAALYTDAYTQFTGKQHDFYFVYLSKKYNSCEVFKASEQLLENGRKKYKEAIETLKRNRASGQWYNKGIQELTLP